MDKYTTTLTIQHDQIELIDRLKELIGFLESPQIDNHVLQDGSIYHKETGSWIETEPST